MAAASRRRIIVSGVSSDAHMWNLVFLQLLLEEHGHEVSNLGSLTPDAEIAGACRALRPDLLVIGTVNGHGHLDGLRLIRALRAEPSLAALPVVIGGKLGVHGRDDARPAARLAAAGYDAVFDDGDDTGGGALARFETYLRALRTPPAPGPVGGGVPFPAAGRRHPRPASPARLLAAAPDRPAGPRRGRDSAPRRTAPGEVA
ncbi:cobalamin-dependent protein [Streptomyces sp. NPDC005722]